MEDNRIVALYWARDDRAIAESRRKYGGYCIDLRTVGQVGRGDLTPPHDERKK